MRRWDFKLSELCEHVRLPQGQLLEDFTCGDTNLKTYPYLSCRADRTAWRQCQLPQYVDWLTDDRVPENMVDTQQQ